MLLKYPGANSSFPCDPWQSMGDSAGRVPRRSTARVPVRLCLFNFARAETPISTASGLELRGKLRLEINLRCGVYRAV